MLKLETLGILNGVEDANQAEARPELFMQHDDADGAWPRFCDWVKANKPTEAWLEVKRLRSKPVQELTSCTEAPMGTS